MTTDRPLRVLFLCTGNSCRSILAECILNRLGRGRFVAYSAGSHPTGRVHPGAIAILEELGYDTTALRSKSWEEFATPGSPDLDFIFTVCDHAAGETCPIWPGRPIAAHWGMEDPAAVAGSDAERRECFRRVYTQLERRIGAFVELPLASLDPATLQTRLEALAANTRGDWSTRA